MPSSLAASRSPLVRPGPSPWLRPLRLLLALLLATGLASCAQPSGDGTGVEPSDTGRDGSEEPDAGTGSDAGLSDAGGEDQGPAACLLAPDTWGEPGRTPVRAEEVANGLEVPWGLAFLPGGDWLITERPGRIRLLRGGVLQPAPVATLTVATGEGGLLGIALHPDFANNRLFFIYFTALNGSARVNRVERWQLSPDGLSAQREKLILDGIPGAPNHDGGRLRIGPDGMLYIGTGDAGVAANAQDPRSLAGKLLRLTPDGDIPADNPFPGSPVFLSGVRNTQGFDWPDASSPGHARLYVSDHGPSGEYQGRRNHDEINFARAGDNLGWPTIYACETAAGLVTPAITFSKAAPPGGLAVYRGAAIPGWEGSVLVGTLGSRHLHRVMFDPADPRNVIGHEVYFLNQYGRLRETVMGPDGQLYLTTSNCDGRGTCPASRDRILRIVAQ